MPMANRDKSTKSTKMMVFVCVSGALVMVMVAGLSQVSLVGLEPQLLLPQPP